VSLDPHWKEIESLFHLLLEADETGRGGLLSRADESVRAEALRLLADHEGAGAFLEEPPAIPPPPPPPQRVGHYEIIEPLGEGGMGVVYLARQPNPDRLVALKLIRPGFVTPSAARHLESEARILGKLEHPGIARIYEAGVATVHGLPQPYLAMERVVGRTLTAWAEEAHLDARSRIALMADVCDAVASAHAQGVIHRDLKPANVLVDGQGRPRVLDFGLARLVDEQAWSMTLAETGGLMGTIAYMPPERLTGAAPPDARTDVYALGVMLYELLAGRRPLALADTTLPEAIRMVVESDPEPIGRIQPQCRGDIETILGAALTRDLTRRYADAGALAGDLRRFLLHRPITARPATVLYRFTRLLRRRRSAALLTLILLAAASMTGFLIHRAGAESARRKAQIEAIDTLVAEVLGMLERREARLDQAYAGRLREASATADWAFEGQALSEAALRERLGDAFHRMALYVDSHKEYARAVALRTEVLGPAHPDTLDVRSAQVRALLQQGADVELIGELRAILAARTTAEGPDHPKTLSTMTDLGMALYEAMELEEAEVLLTEALARQRVVPGEEHLDTLTSMLNLSKILRRTNRAAEALPLVEEAMDRLSREFGEKEPRTLMAIGSNASLLRDLGRLDEAEPLYRRYAGSLRRALGDGHRDELVASSNLASFLFRRNKDDEALTILIEAAQRAVAALDPADQLATRIAAGLGRRLRSADRLAESRFWLETALQRLGLSGEREPGQQRRVLEDLLDVVRKQGDAERATLYESQLRALPPELPEDSQAEP